MALKKPNLFIIGAPKCGTTSIARWLGEHDEIFMSPLKEPFYFDKDINYTVISGGIDSYERLFEHANPEQHKIVGEASTRYLMSDVAVTNILNYNPDSLFLVCVRNPVEMAYSLHQHELLNLIEDVEDFSEAWLLQKERKAGKSIPDGCPDPKFLQYTSVCSIGTQCEEVLTKVSPDKIRFIVLDDVRENPLRAYKSILKFLDVSYDGRMDFEPENEAKTMRSKTLERLILMGSELKRKMGFYKSLGFSKLNTKRENRKPLSYDMRLKLEKQFEPEVYKLENILERDFSAWFRLLDNMR